MLLDVDGVINDLGAADGLPRDYRIDKIESNGFTLFIPEYMPALIQGLTARAEVCWCTTWGAEANAGIAEHLGIGELPVIEVGTDDPVGDWKAPAARSLVEDALEAGRQVFWIEDFAGQAPVSELPDRVTFIDTAADTDLPVLKPVHLPLTLRAIT